MNVLDKIERKTRWLAIPNLMFLLSGMMLATYLLQFALPEENIYSYLYLNWDLIRAGEVWRVLSFLILPPMSSPIFILFSLYFYCLIGNGLERQWGTSRLTLFYLTGVVFAIIGSLFTGYATNEYLNLSLFFAFASLFPKFEILVFFVLPIEVRFLALLDAVYFVYALIVSPWPERIAILLSVFNILIFFWNDIYRTIKLRSSTWKTRRNFKKNMR